MSNEKSETLWLDDGQTAELSEEGDKIRLRVTWQHQSHECGCRFSKVMELSASKADVRRFLSVLLFMGRDDEEPE